MTKPKGRRAISTWNRSLTIESISRTAKKLSPPTKPSPQSSKSQTYVHLVPELTNPAPNLPPPKPPHATNPQKQSSPTLIFPSPPPSNKSLPSMKTPNKSCEPTPQNKMSWRRIAFPRRKSSAMTWLPGSTSSKKNKSPSHKPDNPISHNSRSKPIHFPDFRDLTFDSPSRKHYLRKLRNTLFSRKKSTNNIIPF